MTTVIITIIVGVIINVIGKSILNLKDEKETYTPPKVQKIWYNDAYKSTEEQKKRTHKTSG
jgi:hypothetical protein